MTGRAGIDPRAWLCWAGAAMLMPLMGRNPFALLSVLLAVVAVREALPAEVRAGWGWVIKLGIVFIAHLGGVQSADRAGRGSRHRDACPHGCHCSMAI